MINLKIDDKEISVPEGVTILEAARQANIDIPTLCYLKGINQIGDCRMSNLKSVYDKLLDIYGRRNVHATQDVFRD